MTIIVPPSISVLALATILGASGCRMVSVEERAFCSDNHETRSLPLRIVLSDSSDGFGHPYAHMPWIISSGKEPEGMALIEKSDTIAEGHTDENGVLELDDAQQRRLAQTRCSRRPLWLIHTGQTRAIDIRFDSRRDARCDTQAAPRAPLCIHHRDTP